MGTTEFFAVALILLLAKVGAMLWDTGPWPPVAALLLAAGCMVVTLALLSNSRSPPPGRGHGVKPVRTVVWDP